MRSIRLILIFGISISCISRDTEKISKLLKSDDPGDLIQAYYLIGENHNMDFIKEVISNPYDPRITNIRDYKGMSIYQSKMIALRKISNLDPPHKITYQPDSVVINFYCRWVKKNTKCICP
jgi:hypothetical protein